MAEHAFDQATAVRPAPLAGTGRDRDGVEHATFEVTVDGGWSIGDKPNGGYLVALLARAAAAAAAGAEGLAHPHPLSASALYLSAPVPGPAEARTEVLRRGRRMSQVRTRLVQDGTARVEATFTLGRLDPEAEAWWDDVPLPAGVTPVDECPRAPGFSAPGASSCR